MVKYLQVFVIILLGVLFALGNYWKSRQERSFIPKSYRPLYTPRITGYLVGCSLAIFVYICWRYRKDSIGMLGWCLLQGLLLSGILVVLLLILPLLRKVIRAESCAYLWSILLLASIFPAWPFSRYYLTIPFSPPKDTVVVVLLVVWLVGACFLFLRSVISHFRFRHSLLRVAVPEEDGEIQKIYKKQLQIVNLPEDQIALLRSSAAKTPVSIGVLQKTTCIVLPERAYTPQEMSLILHHELIHISRQDSILKLIMQICAAFMWFHPVAWIATRICADDLERSCDEAVLYGQSLQTRKNYAALLLQTAGDHRGFTTCLSASAKALRYRLKYAMASPKQKTGSVLLGALCILALLGSTCLGIRFQAMPAAELVFQEETLELREVGSVFSTVDGKDKDKICENDAAMLEYIDNLQLSRIVGTLTHNVYEEPRHMQISIHTPGRSYRLTFGGVYLQVLTIVPDGESYRYFTTYYQLAEEPDWNTMVSYL